MKTVEEAYEEALKGINVKKNEALVLENKSSYHSFWFAKKIKGANIKAHERVIINNKKPAYCLMFADYIKDADKQTLSEVVLKSLDEYYIRRFYQEIDFDKSKYDLMLLFK